MIKQIAKNKATKICKKLFLIVFIEEFLADF